jgi:uncharacterized membrane protein
MNRPGFPQSRRWTSPQVAIWLSALIVTITLGILVVTNVVGPWVLLIQIGITVVVSLLAYRAQTERANRNADDHDE